MDFERARGQFLKQSDLVLEMLLNCGEFSVFVKRGIVELTKSDTTSRLFLLVECLYKRLDLLGQEREDGLLSLLLKLRAVGLVILF